MRTKRALGRLLVLPLVALLITSVAAPAVAVDSSRTTPEFASSSVTEERGDVATFTVRMEEGGSADVTILRRGDDDYETRLTLRDRNGDGRVLVNFNTYLSGRTDAFTTGAELDRVVIHSQSGPAEVLPVGNYRLLTGDGTDAAELDIEPRDVDAVTVMVAPASAAERLTTGGDIARYRRANNLTTRPANDTTPVAERDTVVLRFESSGVGGALAAQDGDNATERFRSLIATDLLSFEVHWTNTGAEVPDVPLLLNRSGVSVVPQPDNDAYYIVVDTEAAKYDRGEVESGLPSGARFDVNATVPADSGLATDGRQTETTTFEVVERSASVRTHREGDDYYVLPERGQTVYGRTPLAPGSTLEVQVAGPEDLQQTKTVTVQSSDGLATFQTAFDLPSVGEGTVLEVTAAEGGAPLTEQPTESIVRSPGARLESASLETEGTSLRVALEANLTRGGLLTVRAYNRSGRVLGVTSVESGATSVSVPVADLPPKDAPMVVTAVRDLDADGEFTPGVDVPYEQSNNPRPVTLTITLYELPPSATPTPTASATPTAAPPTTTTTGTASPGDTPTTGGSTGTTAAPGGTATSDGPPIPTEVPGFGPAVAAVALALVALRRMW